MLHRLPLTPGALLREQAGAYFCLFDQDMSDPESDEEYALDGVRL